MKPSQPTPGQRPPRDNNSQSRETVEESTDERTIEWSLEEMAEGLVDDPGHKAPGVVGQGVVARPIEDDSEGARTPRERAARRARRATVPSQVPSLLAKSMRPVAVRTSARAPARDPAAPTVDTDEVTRRVVETDHAAAAEHISAAYSVELIPQRSMSSRPVRPAHPAHAVAPAAPFPPSAVAALVERACAYMKRGDIGQAVMTADEAIAANDKNPELDSAHLEDIASGPLARIFTGGGPLNRLPTVARSKHELDLLVLDELHWALLRRIDGHKTIDQIFAATKIPAISALKIAASLFRAGVIRVEERAHG